MAGIIFRGFNKYLRVCEMTSTEQMIRVINSISASIESILTKDVQLDEEYTKANSFILKEYEAKISQLNSVRNKRIINITTLSQGHQKLLQSAISELNKIESCIKNDKMYHNSALKVSVPNNSFFQTMSGIFHQIELIKKKYIKHEADFSTSNSSIISQYQAKIWQLENARNQRMAKALNQVQAPQKQYSKILSELQKLENSTKNKKKKKNKNAPANFLPKMPNLQAMSEMADRINDATFLGFVKRVFTFDGYNLTSDMVLELTEGIESARAFVNSEIQKITAFSAQEKNNAEQEYQREKAEADNKKTTYTRQNEQQYKSGIADLLKEIDAIRAGINAENQKCLFISAQEKSNAEQEFQQEKTEVDKKKIIFTQNSEQQYKSAVSSLKLEFEKLLNNPDLKQFDEQLLSLLKVLGAFDVDCKDYSPSESYPVEVMLGGIEVPFVLPLPVRDMIKKIMPVAFSSSNNIMMPFTASMGKPLSMQVIYEACQKATVMTGIQSIILKLIRFMPVFTFNLTYIDPNDRGTNLGLLQKLSTITTSDICKKVYASKEDIAKRLKELEVFVDQTSSKIAGTDSIYTFNSTHKAKIPNQFIVINDYPDNFERQAMESLNVLLNNSRKCGISFIFTSCVSLNEKVNSDIIIRAEKNKAVVSINNNKYNFRFDSVIPTCNDFIESVKTVYDNGIKVDNRFSTLFKDNSPVSYMESTHGIHIPFAVDSTRQIISLNLGSNLAAHALLSGRIRSGKSTTLHMLISSIIMNYHPDDVELWLVDYKKVEFAEYIENIPPHVKFVGLERSPEFTFSLLDKINDEFQRRMELFKSEGVKKITEYKEIHGVRSLPRIVLVVDEFHQMTQAIESNPEYKIILENILSEYIAFGLSCVFSDQAISDGLRGLTEKGKKQISVRLAMLNDMAEVRETLVLDSGYYDDSFKDKINRMTTGDVIFKRVAEGAEPVVDKYKTIFITLSERTAVINQATKILQLPGNSYNKKEVLIVDGQHRAEYDEAVVLDFEKIQPQTHSRKTQHIPLYVGTPVNLEPCFNFSLRKKAYSNIMVIGSDEELRASILLHTIHSFKRKPDTSFIVFAHEHDDIYLQYNHLLSRMRGKSDIIVSDLSDMCKTILNLSNYLTADNKQRLLLCWLGLEEILEEFNDHPEKRVYENEKTTTSSNSTSKIDSLMEDLYDELGEDFREKNEGEQKDIPLISSDSISLYNACSDIHELFSRGAKCNLYSFVTFSSIRITQQYRAINKDNFEHKIALKMPKDDWSEYIRVSYDSCPDEQTAVYSDGSGIKTFRPYIIN